MVNTADELSVIAAIKADGGKSVFSIGNSHWWPTVSSMVDCGALIDLGSVDRHGNASGSDLKCRLIALSFVHSDPSLAKPIRSKVEEVHMYASKEAGSW